MSSIFVAEDACSTGANSPRSSCAGYDSGSNSTTCPAVISPAGGSSWDSDSDDDSDAEPLPAYWWLMDESQLTSKQLQQLRCQQESELQAQQHILEQQQHQQQHLQQSITFAAPGWEEWSAEPQGAVDYGPLPSLPRSYTVKPLVRKQLSCLLSKVLRHTASSWGLHIGSEGFVVVKELLAMPCFWELRATLADIMFVVRWEQQEAEKQRFAMRQGAWGPEIRATQGHSQDAVDGQLVSRSATLAELPSHVIHGTFNRYLDRILVEGLRPMSRHHVHLFIEEGGVGRRNAEVHIHVDVAKAHAAGIEFLVSENGVVLSSGGVHGAIPSACFSKVIRLEDGAVLNESGEFQAPPSRMANEAPSKRQDSNVHQASVQSGSRYRTGRKMQNTRATRRPASKRQTWREVWY